MPEPAVNEPKNDVSESVKALVDEMTQGASAMRSAAESMAASAAPKPPIQPVKTVEEIKAEFDTIQREKGTGAALEYYSHVVALPLANSVLSKAQEHAAAAQRSIALKDPELKPLMKRFEKEVEKEAKRRGNEYLATNGYEGIVREIAASDPKFQEERDKKLADDAVAKAKAEWDAANPKPGVAPPSQESVHVTSPGANPPPAASGKDPDLNAIVFTDEEKQAAQEIWGASEDTLKKHRIEREAWKQKLGGAIGVKRAGGIPICSAEFIGLKEGGGRR